jgi:hypothetical protein
MWIVVGACYSMRPAHAEIWLRYLNNLNIPLWGFLGYQMTSPLADNSAEINRQFANALATGSTFLNAWQTANENTGNTPRWTAMVFDHAKNDTLTTLRDLKRGTAPPPRLFPLWAVGRCASHDTTRKAPDPVQINAPPALMVFHQWSFGFWQQMLVTNVDFTQTSFDTAAAKSNGKLVNNNSWNVLNSCNGSPWLDPKKQNLTSMSEWNQALCPNQTYRFSVFPPFNSNFQNGYQDGDTIELSMVHVRQDYSHPAAFLDVFDILQINEINVVDGSLCKIPPPDQSLGVGKIQAATVRNRISFEHTADRPAFEPLSFTVRFKPPATPYLWFWFAVNVVRSGVEVFPLTSFDNFILTLGSPHWCGASTPPADPLPHR